jgi:ATP-dependent Zn protease
MQDNLDGIQELEGTAYHEAGHAVVALLLGFSVEGIGIDDQGGYCIWNETLYVNQDVFPEHWAAVNLAGSVAKEIATGEPDSDRVSQDDLIVRSLSLGTEGLEELLSRARAQAEEILRTAWSIVQTLARALLEYRQLQGEQIQDLVLSAAGETDMINPN